MIKGELVYPHNKLQQLAKCSASQIDSTKFSIMRNEHDSDFCRVNNINEYFKNCSKSAYFKDFNS